jgi:hypothetical protein
MAGRPLLLKSVSLANAPNTGAGVYNTISLAETPDGNTVFVSGNSKNTGGAGQLAVCALLRRVGRGGNRSHAWRRSPAGVVKCGNSAMA